VKNLSLILNVVLLLAVGALYFLFFNQKADLPQLQASTGGAKRSEAVIAYINSDTLLNRYEFSKEIQSRLQELEKKYEAEFANRAKGLENEVAAFQQTAQNMTINQARAREEELLRKRNNLMQYQESLGQKLMAEQA
jgi:outer membrane protein